MTLTNAMIEELDALAGFNDALKKPSAIHKMHLEGEVGYQALIDAGFVRKCRAPKGWGQKNFFGAKVTAAGRRYLASRTEQNGPET